MKIELKIKILYRPQNIYSNNKIVCRSKQNLNLRNKKSHRVKFRQNAQGEVRLSQNQENKQVKRIENRQWNNFLSQFSLVVS